MGPHVTIILQKSIVLANGVELEFREESWRAGEVIR
jgi:hypothetical protein